MKALMLALVLVWGADWQEPDYTLLLPALMEAANQSMMEGELEGAIAVNLGSFVAGMNRELPHPISVSDLATSLENRGRSFSARTKAVECAERPCRWVLEEMLWIQMEELEITETGVAIEARIQVKSTSSVGFVTNVIRYDFDWLDGAWVLVAERALLRS